jgi:hypothetical protein
MAASTTVYLDVDDEITSAASRIRGATENRVALVVPYGSRLGTSRINFRLLAREAQTRGRRLSIVAGDAATRALAASAGLPVFATVNEYDEAEAGAGAPGGDGATGSGAVGTTAATAATVPPPAPADAGASHRARRTASRSDRADGAASRGDEDATTVMPAVAAPAARVTADPRPAAGSRPAAPASAASIPVLDARRLPAWRLGRTAGFVALGAVGLVALVVGVAAFLLLPSAEITITTRTERIGPVALEIRADPSVTEPDPASATVPAQRLQFDVAASDTFGTTGRRVEEEAATGQVTFRSKDPTGANTIARGAIVATPNGIRFRTTAAVSVPPATIVGLTIVPGEASVGIVAVEPGPEGNVEPNAITVIPGGEDPTFTEVRNPRATTGGVREEFPQVSQEEIDAAIADLRGRLDAEFQAILADPARVPPGLTLFAETAVLGDPLPTTDPATLVGTEVPEFILGLATTGTAIAVDEAPVEELARTRITSEVDDGYELVDGSIEVRTGEPIVDGEIVTFPVDARAAQIRILDEAALRDQIRGKPIEQARTILEPYGAVDIRAWPDWVTAIPTIDGRVTVRVVPPGNGPGASPRPSGSSAPGGGGAASPSAATSPSGDPAESVDPGLEGEAPPP